MKNGACFEPGALRTEMEHGRNEQHQKQQTRHHGGERRPLERAGGVGALEVEAAAQEDDADADAEHEAEQTDHGVEVAAAETQHHAQRAAKEDERADHHERAEHEARGGEEPARGRNSRPMSDIANAPSTRPMISGRTYCTFGGAVQPDGTRDIALEAGNTEAHVAGVSKSGQRQRRESHGDAGGKDKPVLFFHVVFSFLRYSDMRIAQENKKVNLICMAKWQFLQKKSAGRGESSARTGENLI